MNSAATDEAPQYPKVERLEHGEKEPHAQFAAEEAFPGPDQQGRHGRMVEIAPCEPFGEHVVIGFVVGEFRQAGMQEVANPPHGKPQEHQPVGIQRGVCLFERCFHSSGQRYKKTGQEQNRIAAGRRNFPPRRQEKFPESLQIGKRSYICD